MKLEIDISDTKFKRLKKRVELGVATEIDMIVYKGKLITPNRKRRTDDTDRKCED